MDKKISDMSKKEICNFLDEMVKSVKENKKLTAHLYLQKATPVRLDDTRLKGFKDRYPQHRQAVKNLVCHVVYQENQIKHLLSLLGKATYEEILSIKTNEQEQDEKLDPS